MLVPTLTLPSFCFARVELLSPANGVDEYVQAGAIEMGWSEFLSEPLVQDVLWAKFTAGVDLENLTTVAREPDRVSEIVSSKLCEVSAESYLKFHLFTHSTLEVRTSHALVIQNPRFLWHAKFVCRSGTEQPRPLKYN